MRGAVLRRPLVCRRIQPIMSTVSEVIDAVKQFTEEQKDEWDRQMEADAKAGRLDFLVREADEAAQGGLLRER